MPLHTIVYVSSSIRRMRSEELARLQQQAQAFNAAHGITGMLLYRDGSFMQALEGEDSIIHALYGRIMNDKRHRGVITMVDEPIESREFGEWSMGLENMDGLVPGLAQQASFGARLLAQLNQAASETAGRSHRLLAGFFEQAIR